MHRWVALLIVLAGCADAAPDEPGVQVSKASGAIEGVVVNEAIVPVAQAQVRLGQDVQTTDAQGRFAFEHLEPGLYALQAAAEGHLPIQASADVAAGQVTKPRIILPIDPRPQPYHTTTPFDGYIEVADAWVTWLLVGITGNTQTCHCEFSFPVAGNASQLVLEAFWVPASPANDPELYWEVFDPSGGFVDADWSTSPLHATVDASTWDRGEGLIRFSVGTTVQIQQEFQAFASVFHHAPAPANWTVAS